jgi:hypothetical protein
MASTPEGAPQRARLLRVDPGIGWRIRRFLGSPGHVVGALFGIAGIVMLNLGLISGLLAAGVIVGLYATGYFLASRPAIAENIGALPAKDSDRIAAGLDQMLATIRKRVAPDIYATVVSTRDAIVYTLDHTGDMQTDPDIYAVRQTAMTYLPEALSKYMSLPRVYAERQIIENGKTSHDILLDQLRLMETKVHEVADSVIERSSQRLVTHGRFIADRFGESAMDAQVDEVADAVSARVAQPVNQNVAQPTAAAVRESEREREKVRVV